MMTSIINVPPPSAGLTIDGETTSRNVTATLTMNVPNGGSFYLRWKDKNIFGSDDALGYGRHEHCVSTGPSAVNNVATNNLPLSLLGNGVSNDVKAAFTAPENGAYTVTVTDLAGRVVSFLEGRAAKGETVVAPVTNTTWLPVCIWCALHKARSPA